MPVYEYKCENCGELFEQTETFAEHDAWRLTFGSGYANQRC